MSSPEIMLFVGARGARCRDLHRSLSALGTVVLVTSRDIAAERGEPLEELGEVVAAPHRDQLLDYAISRARRRRPAGALTLSDDLVEATAAFTTHMGLPGIPADVAPRFRDKYTQRRVLADAGIPVPAFFVLHSPDDVRAALDTVGLPAVLKPTQGSGAAWTHFIHSARQLHDLVNAAFSSARRAPGHLLLEGRLRGERHPVDGFAPYVSVESVLGQGRRAHLAVCDRFPLAPPALETGMALPSSLPPDRRQQVIDMADRALAALDMGTGVAHTEVMFTPEGPRVIEVNARIGGALPYLFPMVSEIDMVQAAGRVAMGERPPPPPEFRGYAVFVGPQHPVDVDVVAVRGLDEVAALDEVRAVIPIALDGTRTEAFRDTLMAAVIGMTGSPEQSVALWRKTMDLVRGEYRSLSQSVQGGE